MDRDHKFAFVAGIDDAGQVKRQAAAVYGRTRVEYCHQCIAFDMDLFERKTHDPLTGQDIKILPWLERHFFVVGKLATIYYKVVKHHC